MPFACWCLPAAAAGNIPFLNYASRNKDLLLSVSAVDTCSSSDGSSTGGSSTDGSLSIYIMLEDDNCQVSFDDDLNSSLHEEEEVGAATVDSPPVTIEVIRRDQQEQPLEDQLEAAESIQTSTLTMGALPGIPAPENSSAPPEIPPFVNSSSQSSVVTQLEVIIEGEALEETRAKQLSPSLPWLPQLEMEPDPVVDTPTNLSTTRSGLPPRPSKKVVPFEERASEKLTRRHRSKSDLSLPESPDGNRHNRRQVRSLREKASVKIADSVSMDVLMNQDVLLETLAETDDVDDLWMEYNVRRSHFGERSPRVGQVLLALGKHEVRQGNYATARSLFQEAFDCTEDDHKAVETGFIAADATFNMGRLALEMQDPALAESYIAKSMCMHQDNEVMHGRDPNAAYIVARCLHTLGVLRTTNGNLESAMYTLQRAVSICEGLAIPQRTGHASVLDSIAAIYFREGKLEKALTYHKDALQIKARAVGRRHVSLVSNYKRLGHVYTESGKYNSATNVYIRAEALLRKEYKRHQRRQDKDQVAELACRLGEMHELLASATTLRDGASSTSAHFSNFVSRACNYYELGGNVDKVAFLQSLLDKTNKRY